MGHFLPRGLLLVFALLASVLLPIGGELGSTISPRQGSAVLASPAVEVLNEADSETVTFSDSAFPRELEVVRRLYADELSRWADTVSSSL